MKIQCLQVMTWKVRTCATNLRSSNGHGALSQFVILKCFSSLNFFLFKGYTCFIYLFLKLWFFFLWFFLQNSSLFALLSSFLVTLLVSIPWSTSFVRAFDTSSSLYVSFSPSWREIVYKFWSPASQRERSTTLNLWLPAKSPRRSHL